MLSSFKEEFTLKYLKNDLPASIAVFLVAIPLCLGIAHASGTPLLSGLITGIVGGIVVGTLSKSPLSVSGPAAGLTAIVSAAAMELQNFESLLVAVFLAGVIQVILGYLKAGTIGDYIPSAVIRGMLAAIGIILILKQIPHLLGYDKESEGTDSFIVHGSDLENAAQGGGGHEAVSNTFSMLFDAVQNMETHIFLIGIVCIALIYAWEFTLGKKLKIIPGSLLAVVAGTLMAVGYKFFQQDWTLSLNHLVQVPSINSFGAFIEQSHFPDWGTLANPRVYMIALTIALVASIETLLSVEAVDKLDPLKRHTPCNRELVAQGVGNSVSGLIGGIPMTSVIVRSSVNTVSGGMTKMSAILHGVWILVAVAFAAPLINMIPLSALAAVLIVIGFKLASPKSFKTMYTDGMDQFIPYVVTIVAIVLTDLLMGVLIGLGVSAVFILYSHYKTEIITRIEKEGVIHLIFSENVTFLNKAYVVELLDNLPDGSNVMLDMTHCKYLDHDVVEAIREFREVCQDRDITLTAESRNDEIEQAVNQMHADRLVKLTQA